MSKYNKCKHCKKLIISGGESGVKKWYGWVYYHSDCNKEAFLKEVSKYPDLVNKLNKSHDNRR